MGRGQVDPWWGPDGTGDPGAFELPGGLSDFELPPLDLPSVDAKGRVVGLAGGDVDLADYDDPDTPPPAAGTVAWLVAQRTAAARIAAGPQPAAEITPGSTTGRGPAADPPASTAPAVAEPSDHDAPGIVTDRAAGVRSGRVRRGRGRASAGRPGARAVADRAVADRAVADRAVGNPVVDGSAEIDTSRAAPRETDAADAPGRPAPAPVHGVVPPQRMSLPPGGRFSGPPPSAHRPTIEPEPSILGLSRHTRSKLGSRLFTLFFVAVFTVILVQLIVSLLDP